MSFVWDECGGRSADAVSSWSLAGKESSRYDVSVMIVARI